MNNYKFNHCNPPTALKHPCRRDCPNRSAKCSVTCEKWKMYVAERNKEYEERIRRIT